jgi:uncharacterized LabA/DUF88 family protein
MAVTGESNAPLAVLIDADNADPKIIAGLLTEVAKFGVASVKRIYGDWTLPNLAQWKAVLLDHSIHPIQQFRYTVGKNATDSVMIIDAMDLLYTGPFGGFCLVSSDSDFTRLASRIRESGKRVYGFGEKKTPRAFVAACDRFIYTEVFSVASAEDSPVHRRSAKELRQDTELLNWLGGAIEATSDEAGWANLGGVGSTIRKQAPDFDSRNYGYAKLNGLIEAIGLFESRREGLLVMIRDKPAATKKSG